MCLLVLRDFLYKTRAAFSWHMSKRQQLPTGSSPADGSYSTEPPTTRLTKRLHVSVASSMSNLFSEGSGSAVWSILPDRASKLLGDSSSDMTSSLNSIKNAYIINCKVLQSRSSFPVPIGVSMNCIPHNEITETGQTFAFTVLPMSHSDVTLTLFEADTTSTENNQWRNYFREYNKENLGTHNILDVQGMPYKFVHETHPVIGLLMANKEILGSDISTHSKIDGEWYKVGTQVLNTAVSTLSSKVLTKLPCQDLSQLQVQLKRIDAVEWTDHSDYIAEHIKSEHNHDSIFDKPCTFFARIEITYELPK